VPRAVLLIVVIAGLAVVNIRGAALGSNVSGIATVAKIVPLIAFGRSVLSHVRAENLALGSFIPRSRAWRSGLLLMFAFSEWNRSLQVSGEVRGRRGHAPCALGEIDPREAGRGRCVISTPQCSAEAIARRPPRAAPIRRHFAVTCSADSIRRNANIRSSPDSPGAESEGMIPTRDSRPGRATGRSATNAMSGTIFATVAMPSRFDPSAHRRMLTTARPANHDDESTARATGATPGKQSADRVGKTRVRTAPSRA